MTIFETPVLKMWVSRVPVSGTSCVVWAVLPAQPVTITPLRSQWLGTGLLDPAPMIQWWLWHLVQHCQISSDHQWPVDWSDGARIQWVQTWGWWPWIHSQQTHETSWVSESVWWQASCGTIWWTQGSRLHCSLCRVSSDRVRWPAAQDAAQTPRSDQVPSLHSHQTQVRGCEVRIPRQQTSSWSQVPGMTRCNKWSNIGWQNINPLSLPNATLCSATSKAKCWNFYLLSR